MKQSGFRLHGFSLIEVLVSVLIMAIGILGLVTIQTTSIRGTSNAYLRTQASVIASDIISRMKANPEAVQAGLYDNVDTATPPSDPACIQTGCNPAELADQDVRELAHYFSNTLGTAAYQPTLPAGSATVILSGEVHEITVQWVEVTDRGAANQTLKVQAIL